MAHFNVYVLVGLFVTTDFALKGLCDESPLPIRKRHSSDEGHSLDITVSPSSIKPGVTNKLVVKCSVDEDDTTEGVSFVSLMASFKAAGSSKYNVLGVITSTDCFQPIKGEGFGGKLLGSLEEKFGGFLTVEILYPDQSDVGEYKCQVSTRDKFFVFSASSSPSVKIIASSVSLGDIAQQLAGIRTRVEKLTTSVDTLKTEKAESDTKLLKIETSVEKIEKTVNSIDPYGWITFQRRADGKENFYRNWADYKHGFGDKKKDFWLGLDEIHNLTKFGAELKVNLEYEGKAVFAHYRHFHVGDEASGYKLSVGGYYFSSNAGDSLAHHNGMKFSTKDKDNDQHKDSCAQIYHGAFWYRNCHAVNLNGQWGAASTKGLCWYKLTRYNSATFTEMKLKII